MYVTLWGIVDDCKTNLSDLSKSLYEGLPFSVFSFFFDVLDRYQSLESPLRYSRKRRGMTRIKG